MKKLESLMSKKFASNSVDEISSLSKIKGGETCIDNCSYTDDVKAELVTIGWGPDAKEETGTNTHDDCEIIKIDNDVFDYAKLNIVPQPVDLLQLTEIY